MTIRLFVLASLAALLADSYVNREGQTLVIIRGPVEFQMGARPGEVVGRVAPDAADEPLHTVRIPRSFAIGTTEVTVAQFQRSLDDNPNVSQHHSYANDPNRMAEVLAQSARTLTVRG